ncbi:hypothetical protein PPYR_02307 [Photinus pyralis]|uniref:HTH CENPB-type domain-containing protein n=2 Tax=Photinus pyralis TaxID=7054 RepID=A0A5N4B6V9_PHOPY|nr:hypothetical protein PPYR_02307 [Photinus pyralis]
MTVKQAILEYFNGVYSEREAARVHSIKRSTLQSRVKKILTNKTKEQYLREQNLNDSGHESDIDDSPPKYSSKYTNRQVFSTQEELELEKYIKRCSDINYGLTYVQIQKLAYEFAIALPHCNFPQEWREAKQAKEGWLRGFMARHKSLALRKPESTSLSRSTAFNKHKVDQFFENLKKVLDKYKFPPEKIYNLDETGVTTVMKPVKIVSTSGKRQVSQAASAERGELVTFIGIINAAGQSIPPVYVFPRVRNIEDFMFDCPVSSLGLGNKSGWMTTELFPKVLQHIVAHTHCTVTEPILLLVDNHESHVNITSVRYCKENGIILLGFAPHTTHRMQPLDVGIYGPFKNYCNVTFNDWMTSNPGKTISVKHIPQLTKMPYLKAFTASNIINSFQKPGIYPFNRLAFTDEDFTPSYVTDQPLITEECKQNRGNENNEIQSQIISNETTPEKPQHADTSSASKKANAINQMNQNENDNRQTVETINQLGRYYKCRHAIM